MFICMSTYICIYIDVESECLSDQLAHGYDNDDYLNIYICIYINICTYIVYMHVYVFIYIHVFTYKSMHQQKSST
jgi:hypothetical protein